MFTLEEKQRYARHFSLPQVGTEGQARLKGSKILCVGAGGLGSPALLYLAAAGVGTLGIVDHDTVELSNLQRQILYDIDDIGHPKVFAARERLCKQNPHITIVPYHEKLTRSNASEIVQHYDVVLDATDNFDARYIVNDICHGLHIPHIYAGVLKFSGECSTFLHEKSICYRCLYPTPPTGKLVPNCGEAGVLGVLPGLIGTIQAVEALKLVLGMPASLVNKVMRIDALTLGFETFILRQDPNCLLCGPSPMQEEHCSMNSYVDISPHALKALMDQGADFMLLDVRQPHEYEICNLGGTLIPLAELPDRHQELDKDKLIIVHCRTDGRSLQAAQWLCDMAFPNVQYLKGGILAWARDIDPGMPQY